MHNKDSVTEISITKFMCIVIGIQGAAITVTVIIIITIASILYTLADQQPSSRHLSLDPGSFPTLKLIAWQTASQTEDASTNVTSHDLGTVEESSHSSCLNERYRSFN
jgi:hypothetical protein